MNLSNEQKRLMTVINLTCYADTCDICSSPARLELTADDRLGVEYFQFCVNPRCINFDGSNLRRKREQLERILKETKSFRRYHDRLWREESARVKEMRKREREMNKYSYH